PGIAACGCGNADRQLKKVQSPMSKVEVAVVSVRTRCPRSTEVPFKLAERLWTLDLGPWTFAAMINYTDKDGKLTFKVRVVPRASRSELVGEHDGALRIRIAAPPVDGAANDELVRLLARAFGVPRSAIDITGGQAAKLKTVCVAGGVAAVL